MKATTIKWHVARDGRQQLARFCEAKKVRSSLELYTANDGEHDYFQITYTFDNGGFITAELIHGEVGRGFSVADHFQIVDYALGAN